MPGLLFKEIQYTDVEIVRNQYGWIGQNFMVGDYDHRLREYVHAKLEGTIRLCGGVVQLTA